MEDKEKNAGFMDFYYEAHEVHNRLIKQKAFVNGLVIIFSVSLITPLFLFGWFSFWPPIVFTLLTYFLAMQYERRKKKSN